VPPIDPISLSAIEFHNLTPEPLGRGRGAAAALPDGGAACDGVAGVFDHAGIDRGELRFVTAALHSRLFLLALNQDVEVAVFKGDFHVSNQVLRQGCSQCVHLTPPDRFRQVGRRR